MQSTRPEQQHLDVLQLLVEGFVDQFGFLLGLLPGVGGDVVEGEAVYDAEELVDVGEDLSETF